MDWKKFKQKVIDDLWWLFITACGCSTFLIIFIVYMIVIDKVYGK